MEVSGHVHAPAALPLEETATSALCIGGWVGTRASLDVMEKIKISFPYQKSNPDSSAAQPLI
jgi:hypothetical protein